MHSHSERANLNVPLEGVFDENASWNDRVMVEVLIAISCTCLGAGMATIWRGNVHRRHIAEWRERLQWWIEHCEQCEQQNGEHIRKLCEICEGAITVNKAWREFLRDKVVIDLAVAKRRDPPQA